MTLRTLVILALAALLARPTLGQKTTALTVLGVVDRSLSIPQGVRDNAITVLAKALADRPRGDRLAVIDAGEAAGVARLPGTDVSIEHRCLTLTGEQTDLAAGVQMAMAVAPPDGACRILLVSDGNQTRGDLLEAARIAAASKIPIDVVPLSYSHRREVVFTRLVAPPRARRNQTISLRMVLGSTVATSGKLALTQNGQVVDLDPKGPDTAMHVDLEPGTNIRTIDLPAGAGGMQEFEAYFVPDTPADDQLAQNNRSSAMTFVVGRGRVLVVHADADGKSAQDLAKALSANHDVRLCHAEEFPTRPSDLMDVDCLVLADTENSLFTAAQQELICRYVSDMGGGLIMTGGPNSFGAGGWIGSPVAKLLPVDLDPSQKKQLPQGALVLVIDHSGSMIGQKLQTAKTAAAAAVSSLSRLDYVGMIAFDTVAEEVVPLTQAKDKAAIEAEIRKVGVGGGTCMEPALAKAAKALKDLKVGARHVIILTDGQTTGDDCRKLAAGMGKAGITISTVAIGDDADLKLLADLAQSAGGRFYPVKDPSKLPQIFIKEAQVVRRALIVNDTFVPQIVSAVDEMVQGLTAMPPLDGYVLTEAKGGLATLLMKSKQGDPVLASGHAGLGKVVVFTSSADSRWAGKWLNWEGYSSFWKAAAHWAAKGSAPGDLEVFADVNGTTVDVLVESVDEKNQYLQLSQLAAQVIAPDMTGSPVVLRQVGPGRYHAQFHADAGGSYLVNLQYVKAGQTDRNVLQCIVTVPFAPEFQNLSDNTALLAQVAHMTGGRVLQGNAAGIKPFDRQGVHFPQSAMPLTAPLALAWVALFLLDVAVRRLRLNLAAPVKALVAAMRKSRTKALDPTLERLKQVRQAAKKKLDRKSAAVSHTRYEAPAQGQGERVKLADTSEPARAHSPAAAQAPQQQASTVDRLLKIKKKTSQDMRHR